MGLSDEQVEALAGGPLDDAVITRLLEDPFLAEQVIELREDNDQPIPAMLTDQHHSYLRSELLFLAVLLPVLIAALTLLST